MSIDNEKLSELMKDGWSYPIKTKLGAFELIDTIKLTENAGILINTEPDGTPYNFDRVFLRMKTNRSQEGFTVTFDKKTYNDRAVSIYVSTLSQEGDYYAGAHAWIENGYWTAESYMWRSVSSAYQSTYHTGNDNTFRTTGDDNVVQIRINPALKVGFEMEIWAVRAKK